MANSCALFASGRPFALGFQIVLASRDLSHNQNVLDWLSEYDLYVFIDQWSGSTGPVQYEPIFAYIFFQWRIAFVVCGGHHKGMILFPFHWWVQK